MPNYVTGMRVRVMRVATSLDAEMDKHLPFEATLFGPYSVDEDDVEEYGPAWYVALDSSTYVGRSMGSSHNSQYNGVYGTFFYECEIEPAGPPETVRAMSYQILSKLEHPHV